MSCNYTHSRRTLGSNVIRCAWWAPSWRSSVWVAEKFSRFSPLTIPPHTHTASLAGSGTQPRRLQPPPHTCWRDWRDNRPGCEALIVWDVWEKSIDCVCVQIFKTFWHQFEDFHHFFHRRSSLHVILLLNIQKMTLMTENLQKLLGHLGIFLPTLREL